MALSDNWNIPVDNINGQIHYLAYHGKNALIESIDKNTLTELILQLNAEGDTICHIAAKMNNQDLILMIIRLNLDLIYWVNKLKFTPLYYMLTYSDLIKDIIHRYKIRDCFVCDNCTLTQYYILNNDVDMALFIIDNIMLNSISKNALFSIIQSDFETNTKIILLKLMLEKNIDVNSLNIRLLSPLIIAVYQHDYDIVKFLLKSGANPNYFGPENNENPLKLVIIAKDIELIKLLLESNADINIVDKYLRTPLHYLFNETPSSTTKIPLSIKSKLVTNIRNINSTDIDMNSILNLLIANDNWKLYTSILQKKKLKINLKNKNGISPLDHVEPDDRDEFYELVYASYINQLHVNRNWVDNVDHCISAARNPDTKSYRNYIMQKIIKGQSYPLVKNDLPMIKMIVPPTTNITHFSSYTHDYICYLYYILKKYPEIKIPDRIECVKDHVSCRSRRQLYKTLTEKYRANTPYNMIFRSVIKDYISHSPILINHLVLWKSDQMYFVSPNMIEGIRTTIEKYPNAKFILMKLTVTNEKNFNHANMIIFDVNNNFIERFDPYGYVPFIDGEKIDKLLQLLFLKHFPTAKFLSPRESSNSISFQIFSDESNKRNTVNHDPAGFCLAWCIWYVEVRIKNINIEPRILIRKMIDQINKSITNNNILKYNQSNNDILKYNQSNNCFIDYIRNYSNYLNSEKNAIFNQAGIPEKYWYRHHIPVEYYTAYLKYIRKRYDDLM